MVKVYAECTDEIQNMLENATSAATKKATNYILGLFNGAYLRSFLTNNYKDIIILPYVELIM